MESQSTFNNFSAVPETIDYKNPIVRAIMVYVDGFRHSCDFSCRGMNARSYYGRAIDEGYIKAIKTSFHGRVDYYLTDKGRQYGRLIYADSIASGRGIIIDILADPIEAEFYHKTSHYFDLSYDHYHNNYSEIKPIVDEQVSRYPGICAAAEVI